MDHHYHHQPTEHRCKGRVRSVLNAALHTAEDMEDMENMEGDARQDPSQAGTGRMFRRRSRGPILVGMYMT